VDQHKSDALDKLKIRIQSLRAESIDNGCTEDENYGESPKLVGSASSTKGRP
jgi:hypothetical protein